MRASVRRSLATLSVLALGLAACADDESQTTESDAEVTDEGVADDGDFQDGDDPAAAETPEGEAPPAPDEQPEMPTFEEGDLEDGEVVPGVRMDEVEGADVQAGPAPTGAAYAATLPDQTGLVFVDVTVGVEAELDDLLAQVDEIESSGQGTIEAGPDDLDVPGADDAARVDLSDASGEADATLVVAVADGSAVSVALEQPAEGGELDIDALVDSIELDAERLAESGDGAGELPLEQAPDEGAGDAPVDEDAPATEPEEEEAG
jgi:hypothetical protein